MSEEEKKAIDNFKRLNFFEYDWEIEDYNFETREDLLSYAEKMQKIILHLIEKQQKEIEEKTTILLAGAEKVKQLEKEIQRLEKDNDTLSELVIVNEDKVIKELDLISKDKIRKYFMHEIAFKKRLQREKQKIDKYNRGRFDAIEEILELLEEN